MVNVMEVKLGCVRGPCVYVCKREMCNYLIFLLDK